MSNEEGILSIQPTNIFTITLIRFSSFKHHLILFLPPKLTKNYFCAESRVTNQLSTATLPPPDNIKDTHAANSANPNS